jgi:methyl-accepting chemotaxis protein
MHRITNLGIQGKLLAGFALPVALLVVIAIVATTSMSSLHTKTEQAHTGAVLDEQIMSMEIATLDAVNLEKEAVIERTTDGLHEELKAAFVANDGDAFREAHAEAYKLGTPEMRAALDDSKPKGLAVEATVAKTLELVDAGQYEAAAENHETKTEPAIDEFVKANQAVEEKAEAYSEAATVGAKSAQDNGTRAIVIVAIIAALAAAGVGFLLARKIKATVVSVLERIESLRTNDATELASGLDAMAAGDLTYPVESVTPAIENPGADEIGQIARAVNGLRETVAGSVDSYTAMTEKLRGLIGNVAGTAGVVSSASQEMAATSEQTGRAVNEIASAIGDVAQGSERQVQMVDSAKHAADEVSVAVNESAENARQTAAVAEEARNAANEGVEAAEQATEAMHGVRDSSHAVSEAIRELAGKSEAIGAIVETITGIAGQTNLLALNAAIEAARAGEQGRGFAVVAEEVRKLAEESQKAAGEIAELIEKIQAETGNVVVVVEDGAERTERGAEVVDRTRAAFERIGSSVEEMGQRVTQIASAAEQIASEGASMQQSIAEVAAVAEQSSASTEQVSASTQQTSASAQEIAASAQQLASSASDLEKLVGTFKVTA